MSAEQRNLAIEREASESSRQMARLLADWSQISEFPRLGVLCIGASNADDLLRNPDHQGVADLIHASMTLLRTSFLAAWSISKPNSVVERAVLRRRLEIELAFSESLNGPSGRSVFGQLGYLPSIVIILTHGSRGPVPYLQDERGGGFVTASDAASELGSLPGRNLLVVLPCCFASTVSEPFLENDRIGSVFAPLDEEIGDREVASMLRALGDEIRRLDVFSISRGFSNAET